MFDDAVLTVSGNINGLGRKTRQKRDTTEPKSDKTDRFRAETALNRAEGTVSR